MIIVERMLFAAHEAPPNAAGPCRWWIATDRCLPIAFSSSPDVNPIGLAAMWAGVRDDDADAEAFLSIVLEGATTIAPGVARGDRPIAALHGLLVYEVKHEAGVAPPPAWPLRACTHLVGGLVRPPNVAKVGYLCYGRAPWSGGVVL